MTDVIEYVHLRPYQALPERAAAPYKALIVAEAACRPEWRQQVADWIVATGCIYAMSCGVDGGEWEDAVDLAHNERFNFQDSPDDQFVMTTRHDTLEDAFWFTKYAAHHPTVELPLTNILHVADTADEHRLRAVYDSSPPS